MMKRRIHIKTMLAALTLLAITSCTDEDLAQVSEGKAGQLHIASVNVGDSKVASRAEGESGETTTVTPGYNEVVTEVNQVYLSYSFEENSGTLNKTATATNSSGNWTISASNGVALQPSADNEKWEDLQIEATNILGETDNTSAMPEDMDIASLDDDKEMRIYQDKLFASNNLEDDGGITVATTLGSAQLGEMSITLKHVHALLHLPKPSSTATTTDDESASQSSSSYNVVGGIYVQDGVAYQIVDDTDPLLTLWAELEKDAGTIYVPLTGEGDVLQAIAPADYTLTAFKAVLDVVGDDNEHFVLDLPISATNGQQLLSANTQYNLNLTITPRVQKVELQRTDKPGWGNDDVAFQQFSNEHLKYENGNKRFVVKSATGLQELNKWMTKTGGDNVKYIEGYEDVDQTASRLSHDIHVDREIDLSNSSEIFDLDGEGDKMSNWKPLGTADTPYTGTITAEVGAVITGLKIHVNTNNGGFVGYLGEDGKIEGLKLQGNFSTTSATFFGAVVGYNNGGTITGCVVGTSSSDTEVRGIINDSKTYSYIGGVVGWNNTGLVTDCINYATVYAPEYNMVGGVLGENHRLDNCVIKDCENYGAVTGLQHVGGVVGINHRVVNNCHNEGNVLGKLHVGGVVGMSNDYSPIPDSNGKPGWPIYVINATNKGKVEGERCVGGVVGSNGSSSTSGGYIVASWNTGNISYQTVENSATESGTFYALGGVVGVNYHTSRDELTLTVEQEVRKGNRTSQIIACYNTGSITTTEAPEEVYVGGIVGVNRNGSKVWACYYSNSTEGDKGCGKEENEGSEVGRDYTNVTEWDTAITAMNTAIEKYKKCTDEDGYGIVENPSNPAFSGITTTVKTYKKGDNLPQLESVTGN